jgi:hypothetical protein
MSRKEKIAAIVVWIAAIVVAVKMDHLSSFVGYAAGYVGVWYILKAYVFFMNRRDEKAGR